MLKILFSCLVVFSPWAYSTQFELATEDGLTRYPCQAHQKAPGDPRWDLTCGSQKFAVHFMINRYPQAKDILRYQILYWVLDYQERPDSSLAGTYHGSNVSVSLMQNQPPQVMELGQVVQTIWNLNVKFALGD